MAIQRWKEIVTIENKSEHLRDADDRAKLHRRTVTAIAALREEVDQMDVATTMDTIKELMQNALDACDDISNSYEKKVKPTLQLYDQHQAKSLPSQSSSRQSSSSNGLDDLTTEGML